MTPMPTDLMIELRDIFVTYFGEEDLKDFMLALGVDYENLSGSSKSAKARELALYLWRHSKLPQLAVMGPKRRPDIDWASVLGPYMSEMSQPAGAPPPPTSLNYQELQSLVPILMAYPDFESPGSRRAFLKVAGVDKYINTDLNGSSRSVANGVLAALNDFGRTPEGDIALGRLLSYLMKDETLAEHSKDVIKDIVVRYNLV